MPKTPATSLRLSATATAALDALAAYRTTKTHRSESRATVIEWLVRLAPEPKELGVESSAARVALKAHRDGTKRPDNEVQP